MKAGYVMEIMIALMEKMRLAALLVSKFSGKLIGLPAHGSIF